MNNWQELQNAAMRTHYMSEVRAEQLAAHLNEVVSSFKWVAEEVRLTLGGTQKSLGFSVVGTPKEPHLSLIPVISLDEENEVHTFELGYRTAARIWEAL